MKLESAITYAVLKTCENSDQEDKDSNCPTMHKTVNTPTFSDSQPFMQNTDN